MTIPHGRQAVVYVNGYNLSPLLDKVSTPFKHDVHPYPTFGKTAIPKLFGFENGEAKLDGFLDSAAVAGWVTHDVLGDEIDLFYGPDGDTLAGRGNSFTGLAKDAEYTAEDAPNRVSAGYESNTGVEPLIIHRALAACTASVNGTAVEAAAATTVECIGQLQVMAYSGLTSIAAKWQSAAASGGPWVDITGGAHTLVTAGRASERIVIPSGTAVEAFTRLVLTVVGTGSADVFAAFGRRNS